VRLSKDGRTAHARLVTARRRGPRRARDRLQPDDQAEVEQLLDRLAHEFVREILRAQAPFRASG
jgi:hypothetical protein